MSPSTSALRKHVASRPPETSSGFGHDIPFRGAVYHVQTELLTAQVPLVETHVFLDGQVIGSARQEVEILQENYQGSLIKAMQEQHKALIRQLIAGELTQDQDRGEESRKQAAERLIESAASLGHLDLRRALIRFVRAVGEQLPAAEGETEARLRTILTAIAVIVGNSHIERARHEDLAELLMLRSEGIDWMRQGSKADSAQGLRLWRGFARIAATFSELNQRRLLIEHDLDAWRRCQQLLADLDPEHDELPTPVISALKSTWGRARELDDILDGSRKRSIRAISGLLEEQIPLLEAIERKQRDAKAPVPRERAGS